MTSCQRQGTTQVCFRHMPIGHTHTHAHLMALCPGLPGLVGTRKVKPIRILLKQETMSDSFINWAICKSAPRFRHIIMPAPHQSVFTGQMPFLPPNQQHQSTEGMPVGLHHKKHAYSIKKDKHACQTQHIKPT